jgi:RimJ/RimL family protein N-acetyltransferase
MEIVLKPTDQIELTPTRESWLADPEINEYVCIRDKHPREYDTNSLTNFDRFYEIFEKEKHVGDIKVFYETEADIFEKRGQILIVVGERNRDIGTNALNLLIHKIGEDYESLYCKILRSNIASLKILKKNGFILDNMDGDILTFSRQL